MDSLEQMEMMGDALNEVFGQEYDVEGPELDCPMCGTYGSCDCESSDLEKF